MRPDQRWFPTNRIERAAWFANFSKNFAQFGLELGFTQAEIDSVTADNALLQYVARYIQSLDAYVAAVKSYQRTITLGSIGEVTPEFPAPPPLAPPASVETGIFERLERIVRRVRVAPKYTPAIGASLSIIPANPNAAALSERPPKLTIGPGPGSYSFTVKTTKGPSKMMLIEVKRNLSEVWETAGHTMTSSTVVAVPPQVEGEPEMIQVRLRRYVDNKPSGVMSDIKIVALTP